MIIGQRWLKLSGRPDLAHRLVAEVTTLAALGLALCACGQSSSAATGPAPSIGRATASSTSGQVLWREVPSPRVASTSAGLYLAWQVSPLGSVELSELARVDPATGRIEASRRLGAAFDQAIAAGGSLWVATSLTTSSASSSKQGLLRLNPRTLAITGRWSDLGGGGSLALAGGGLWVAGRNRLSRLSLPEGKVTASVSLPGAASSDVAANAAGTILIVGEANKGGLGALERRDPKTGKFLASYRSIFSVGGPPWVGGVIGQGVWVHAASGMMGSVERFAATTLTLDRSTIIEGSNGITVLVANGLIWVSHAQVEGGPTRNFCGDPSDGRALAPLNIPPDSELLAVGAHNVYYASAPDDQERQNVNEEPIPDACRVR